MEIVLMLRLWMIVPAATTLFSVFLVIWMMRDGESFDDASGLSLAVWACLTVPALIVAWLA